MTTQPEALPSGAAFEVHFTPTQLAAQWHLSADIIRRTFENEPGVIHIGHNESMHRRRYVSLRIPASVASRVHRKLTQKPQ